MRFRKLKFKIQTKDGIQKVRGYRVKPEADDVPTLALLRHRDAWLVFHYETGLQISVFHPYRGAPTTRTDAIARAAGKWNSLTEKQIKEWQDTKPERINP